MSVTQEEVNAAREAADKARDSSKAAHDEADRLAGEAESLQKQAEEARKTANETEAKAAELEKETARRQAVADASKAKCDNAGADLERAEAASAAEAARAARVQAQNPGVCNADTDAADARAEAARKSAETARQRRDEACAQARADAAAVEEARKESDPARQAANDADATADEAERAAMEAGTAAVAGRAKAIGLAGVAYYLGMKAEDLSQQLSVQTSTPATPGPRPPDTNSAAGPMGAGPAPADPGGIRSDTHTNFTIGGKAAIFQVGGKDYEQIGGKLVEITVGNKIVNVLAFEATKIFGGKLEEVGGWESKLVLMGDRRLIIGKRWERNVGVKAETVLGDATEITLADQDQHVPTINAGFNPTNKTETCPRLESNAAKIVEQHKDKLKELRKTVKLDFRQSTEYYDSVKSRIEQYKDEVGKIGLNVRDMIVKTAELKTEAKKYQMKSDAFIKFMVSGTCKLKAGSFKGSAKKRYHLVSDAITQLQGQVKWN